MTLSESDYSQLKSQLVQCVVNSPNYNKLLQSLKELFQDGINSVRRFEQITSIEQLLHVLELRYILSEDNVGPLNQIAREIKSPTLLKKIQEYEENHEPKEYSNCYASEKANKSTSSFVKTTPHELGVCNKKKELIFQIIIEQIGSSWRDLGRSLKVQECKIDEIDDNYGTMATKASTMLKHFDSRADSHKWHFTLCNALDNIRRKELRLAVQEILMRNTL